MLPRVASLGENGAVIPGLREGHCVGQTQAVDKRIGLKRLHRPPDDIILLQRGGALLKALFLRRRQCVWWLIGDQEFVGLGLMLAIVVDVAQGPPISPQPLSAMP